MSDTVMIEEEKNIEHIAAGKVAVIRKKMLLYLSHRLQRYSMN